MEIVHKRPYLTVFLVWLLVYVPIAILSDSRFGEETTTYSFDRDDETNRVGNTTIFMHDERGLILIMNLSKGSERIEVQVDAGYVPMDLRIGGLGKLYTSDEYDSRRTWKLGWDKVLAVQGANNLTFTVDVTREGSTMVFNRDRGNTIIEGKTLYRDVPTHEPPFNNVFWVLPSMLGGSTLVFRLYMGLFVLLSALVLMKGWNDEGKFRMVAIGLILVLNPLSIYTTVGMVQNGAIMLFLFSSALALYKMKRRLWSSVSVGLGMSTGLFGALLIPGLLAERDELYRRVFRSMLAIAIGVAPLLVLRAFEPEGVDHFLGFYLTGGSGHLLQGISLWRLLDHVGLPAFVILPGLAIFGAYMLHLTVRKKRLGLYFTGLLLTFLFLNLYPNIHAGAFLLPLAFLPFFWELDVLRNTVLALGSAALLLDIMLLSGFENGLLIMVPFILSLLVHGTLIYLTLKVIGSHMRFENRLGYTKY